jgi:2-polyprenyl-3-methyl-5-hydroxy-6-metoxy-1,4-benzoquinol methylase
MDLRDFYTTSTIANSSQRGYYPEKTIFIHRHLSRLSANHQSPLKILDVACNDGELTSGYQSFGNVLGIDINPVSIAKCQQRQINCLCTSIENIPSRYHHTFDVIIAGDIIEHVFDTDLFLDHIRTLLLPGGTLLLTTPNVASLPRRFLLLLGINPFLEYSTQLPSQDYNVGHVRYYTAVNLRHQLQHHGFLSIELKGDRIHLAPTLFFPISIAQYLPTLSRHLLAAAVNP